jgi:hypothetical protein
VCRQLGANPRRIRAVRSSRELGELRELWLWLGGLFLTLFAFLAAVAIAYFSKEPRYSLFANPWMPLALVSFALAFAAFLGAAMSWTIPALPLPAAPLPDFPDLTIEVTATGSTDTERESSSGLDVPAHLRSLHARFTSAETERTARLEVSMYVKLVAGSWGRAGEVVCPVPSWTLPPSLGLSPMTMPFELPPGQEASGQFVFEVPKYYHDKIVSPMSARLEIFDNVSGKRASVPAELGLYESAVMTSVPGGAEMLGSEFESGGELAQPA